MCSAPMHNIALSTLNVKPVFITPQLKFTTAQVLLVFVASLTTYVIMWTFVYLYRGMHG